MNVSLYSLHAPLSCAYGCSWQHQIIKQIKPSVFLFPNINLTANKAQPMSSLRTLQSWVTLKTGSERGETPRPPSPRLLREQSPPGGAVPRGFSAGAAWGRWQSWAPAVSCVMWCGCPASRPLLSRPAPSRKPLSAPQAGGEGLPGPKVGRGWSHSSPQWTSPSVAERLFPQTSPSKTGGVL